MKRSEGSETIVQIASLIIKRDLFKKINNMSFRSKSHLKWDALFYPRRDSRMVQKSEEVFNYGINEICSELLIREENINSLNISKPDLERNIINRGVRRRSYSIHLGKQSVSSRGNLHKCCDNDHAFICIP